jgi:formylglycine-generating enzyme required for sulfatase activity
MEGSKQTRRSRRILKKKNKEIMNKKQIYLLSFILMTMQLYSQERRLALLIGNSNYGSSRNLENPKHDVESMATSLRQLGFEVLPVIKDANLRQMEEAITSFIAKLKGYESGLFFYAGHGMEVEGENYLLPIDLKSDLTESDIKHLCYKSDRLRDNMDRIGGSNRSNIVILDACRDNPFRSMRGSPERAWAQSGTHTPKVLTCYSSSKGGRASDGLGKGNSPFTEALVRYMTEPGSELRDVLISVRQELSKQGNQFVEWDDKLNERFYFTKRTTPTPTVPTGLIDSDGDGITDGVDKCPFEKGELRNEGCPSGNSNQGVNYTERNKGINMDMVYVEGGSYTMGCTAEQGSDCYDNEKPSHKETVGSFYISKTEVTQAQWALIMGGDRPSYISDCDACPVERVSWDRVQEFIQKLNSLTGLTYRLPMSVEWEYAARGGQKSRGYKYSGSNEIGDVAWYIDNSGWKAHAVGGLQSNELGLYDMSGNVWEWCSDHYSKDYNSPRNSALLELRGGSCYDYPQSCRVANRGNYDPSYMYNFIGFRLCRTLAY